MFTDALQLSGVIVFLLASGLLAVFGANHCFLGWTARRRVDAHRRALAACRARWCPRRDWPAVAVQIPLFNESAVAERCIRACAALDYPQLHIQVLDDSTDETTAIVSRLVNELRARGVSIELLHRERRAGYKAGALAEGMASLTARYIAIFDADFVPPPDFLRRAIPLFDFAPRIACVQGRWTHFNADQTHLTQAQAVSIDAHFGAQQLARCVAGLPLNSNGSVTVWDAAAIRDAGGWSAETITEDLELSYRAQLRGWRIVLDPDLTCPGELPGDFRALRSQQRRWACGSIHTSRLYLGAIWRGPWRLAAKMSGTLHLLGYVASTCMVVQLLTAPCAWWFYRERLANVLPGVPWIWLALLLLMPSSILMCRAGAEVCGSLPRFRRVWPWLLLLGAGLAPNALLAVLRGMFRPWREFVRTQKRGGSQGREARFWRLDPTFAAEIVFLMLGAAYLGWAVRERAWLILFWAGWLGVGLLWTLRHAGEPEVAAES
jgi:cellulose synthase/poly-beta-1,6-N-acetylglucosamine synthase-like glycosyltransferase